MLALKIFDITLIGVNTRTGAKLLFTLALFTFVLGLRWLASSIVRHVAESRGDAPGFWSRQGLQLTMAVLLILGIGSIWIDAGTNLTTGIGLVSAALAFALQQLITSIAAYFVILRGDMFSVGDRIELGDVRGDVIRLGFIKTTVMEMGQPAGLGDATSPVHGRQYTGRVVTVTNGTIFTDPVFNYTREFPYVWDEIVIPITYDTDRAKVEEILLAAAHHGVPARDLPASAMEVMRRHYAVSEADLEPQVFMRITDNWLEMSLRFLLEARSVRTVKNAITREIMAEFDANSISVASSTYDIVGMPPVRLAPVKG